MQEERVLNIAKYYSMYSWTYSGYKEQADSIQKLIERHRGENKASSFTQGNSSKKYSDDLLNSLVS